MEEAVVVAVDPAKGVVGSDSVCVVLSVVVLSVVVVDADVVVRVVVNGHAPHRAKALVGMPGRPMTHVPGPPSKLS